MTTTTAENAPSTPAAARNYRPEVLYLLVFFSGFANLATEIIGPRMLASLFGTTTVVWAIMISVTLVGLSVGYAIGGRIKLEHIHTFLPSILATNAGWLLIISWIVWQVPADAVASGVRVDASLIFTVAMAGFFIPSVLFGMTSPIAITLLGQGRKPEAISTIVGNIYALSTVGSVAGALGAAFILIPWVGLSPSVQVFAAGLVLFAAYFWWDRRRPMVAAMLIACVLFPQPDWQWTGQDDMTLLAQQEGYYQTIRVYEDGNERIMNLGPTNHSRVDMDTLEPTFNYAVDMVEMAEARFLDLTGVNTLILGAAGHGIAHGLENRGAIVTEVEIDPFVAELSDEYFGEIQGETIIQDGRIYMELVEENTFDLILIDVFDAAANVPPQFVTQEFFQATQQALTDEGLVVFNFVGTPQGQRSRSFKAVATTLQAVFDYVGADDLSGDTSENIILVAANSEPDGFDLLTPPDEGVLLTDNRNPIEIFTLEARDFAYFRR